MTLDWSNKEEETLTVKVADTQTKEENKTRLLVNSPTFVPRLCTKRDFHVPIRENKVLVLKWSGLVQYWPCSPRETGIASLLQRGGHPETKDSPFPARRELRRSRFCL